MADFPIRVTFDGSAANRGAAAVGGSLGNLEARANSLRSTLLATFGITSLGAAIAGSVRLLAGFEQQMATVRAVSGATEVEFASLREEAERLGANTRFTASQAAEAMTELGRAGFTATQQLETTNDVLTLAQAGALGLGEAAGITASALAGFRLETDQAGRVADVLAAGANSAKTTVRQLGNAISFVAPVAASLNVDLEETTSALLSLSNAGIESTRAGTGLRKVLSTLEQPGGVALGIFDALGIKAEEVKVSQVGLTQALTVLREKGLDATTGALEVFGERGGPAFEVLASSIPAIQTFDTNLRAAGGTAQRVADIMDDNLNGALLATRSAIEAVVIAFGNLGASSFLTRFFRGLAAGFRFVAENVDALAVALAGPLAGVAIPAVIGGIKALTFALLANPFTAILTVISLVAAALIAFQDNLRFGAGEVANFGDLARATLELIQVGIESLLGLFGDFGTTAETETDRAGKALEKTTLNIDLLVNAFAATINAVTQFGAGLGAVANFAVNAIGNIFEAFTDVERIAKSLGTAFQRLLVGDFQGAFNALADAGGNLAENLTTNFDQLKSDLLEVSNLDPGQELLDRAQELAGQRRERERAAEAAAGGGVPTAPPTETGDTAGQITGFKALNAELVKQEEVLNALIGRGEAAAEVVRLQQEQNLKLTDSERALLEERVNQLTQLETQAAILQELKGPQLELEHRQAALNALLSQGKITLDEYSQSMREVANAIGLTASQGALLQEIQGPQQDLAQRQSDLRVLFEQGRVSAEQFGEQMGLLQQKSFELQGGLVGGLGAGLQQIANDSNNLGASLQGLVVNSFDRATDAILNFREQGSEAIKALVSDILQQLAKLALQKAAVGALSSAFGGGGGGGGGGVFGSLFASAGQRLGGQFTVPSLGLAGSNLVIPGPMREGGGFNVPGGGGADSKLVAFPASPGEEVQVRRPDQQQSMEPVVVPPPAVNNIIVRDPDEVPNALRSRGGREAMMEFIDQNADTIKERLEG